MEFADLFKHYGVRFAYRFGSTVDGTANDYSDVDFAVFFDDRTGSYRKRTDMRFKLSYELRKLTGREVDLVVLNDVKDLFFKYVIVKEGQIVFFESDLEFAEFESRVYAEYFDFAPFLDEYNKAYVARSLQ